MPTWVVSEQTLVDGGTADDAVERVIEGIDGRALTRRADLAGAEPTLLPAAQVAALRQWALGLVPGEPSEQLQVGRRLVRELIDTVELAGRSRERRPVSRSRHGTTAPGVTGTAVTTPAATLDTVGPGHHAPADACRPGRDHGAGGAARPHVT